MIRQVFREGYKDIERRFFPESSQDVPDTPSLKLVVLAPEHGWQNAERDHTRRLVETMISEYGSRGRTYKSGLIFVVADGSAQLVQEARTLLALEQLDDPVERERLRLEEDQIRELGERKARSKQNLENLVWGTYRHLLYLNKDGKIEELDLGILHPSAARSIVDFIVSQLKQHGLLEEAVTPDFLCRKWPPAFQDAWSTKSIRDMFYASPSFPRLINPEVLRKTIVQGVRDGKFGYRSGEKVRFKDHDFTEGEVEFSDDVFLVPADKVLEPAQPEPVKVEGEPRRVEGEKTLLLEQPPAAPRYRRCAWEGELKPQKWSQFYLKVLTRFATDPSLQLRVRFEVNPEQGISQAQLEEIKAALRELGLGDALEIEEGE